jgi:hypothetical protein
LERRAEQWSFAVRFSLHTFTPAAVGAAILSTPAFADAGAQPSSAPSLLDIVTHTPVWAWLVLVALVWLGLQRTKPRDVGVARLVRRRRSSSRCRCPICSSVVSPSA